MRWALLALLPALLRAQPDPVFRSGTRLVQVDVVVRAGGLAVEDLELSQFTLLDEGRPQKIAVFSLARSGVRTAGRPLPAGVVSNRVDARGEQPVSATVVLFDALNTRVQDQNWAREQLLLFLRGAGAREPVALYSLNTSLRVLQDFTSDAGSLLAAAGGMRSEQSPGLRAADIATNVNALIKAEQSVAMGVPGADGSAAVQNLLEEGYRDRVATTVAALQQIARRLAGLPGRKKLIWISSGFAPRFLESRNGSSAVRLDAVPRLTAAMRALNNANIALYPIDPRGALSAGLRDPQIETLHLLAQGTGGMAAYNRPDVEGALQRASRDTEAVYTLGFYPETKLDGKYHGLTVKVARGNVQVRHRMGYLAAEGATAGNRRDAAELKQELDDAFRTPLESTALSVVAMARPAGSEGTFELALSLDASELDWRLKGDQWMAQLTLATKFSAKPEPNGSLEEVRFSFTREQLAKVVKEGLVVRHPYQARGWQGELRLVLQDQFSGKLGSVRLTLR